MTQESRYIHQMKQGQYEGFDGLYRMYVRRLYGFCYKYTKSRENAEEIVQDVFVKLWTNRGTIMAEDTVLYWLFTTAKNRIINIYRSQVNSPNYEEYLDFCDTINLSICDTANKIEYDDFCTHIEKAKQQLSDTQKAIFHLSFEQQLSYKEIAVKLSLHENTVKNQVCLTRKILKQYLSENVYLLMFLFLS